MTAPSVTANSEIISASVSTRLGPLSKTRAIDNPPPAMRDDLDGAIAIEHDDSVGEHEVFDAVAEVAQHGDAGHWRTGMTEVAAAAVVAAHGLDRTGQQRRQRLGG